MFRCFVFFFSPRQAVDMTTSNLGSIHKLQTNASIDIPGGRLHIGNGEKTESNKKGALGGIELGRLTINSTSTQTQ